MFRYLNTVLTIVSFLVILCFSIPTSAEVCPIGYVSVQASPLFMRFDAKKSDCNGDCEAEKYLIITSSGDTAMNLYPVEINPLDPKSKNAFDVKVPVSYGYSPSQSGRLQVFFRPKEIGFYQADIVVTYGYESNALGRFRECVQKVYGAEVIQLLSLVQEMEARGPNFEVIEKRITDTKDKHSKTVSGITYAISQVDQELIHLAFEKDEVLEELREGYFCSQCGDSKTQIESHGENFMAHLKRVNGHIIPADDERIEAKEREYNAKMQVLRDKITRYRKEIEVDNQSLKRDLQTVEDQRMRLIEAFQNSLNNMKRKLMEARKRKENAMAIYDAKYAERKTITVHLEGDYRAK